MSDHPREAERNLKRIYICDDIWYNIFDGLDRAELGLKIAPISDRFDGLVDRHLMGIRRWTIGHIGFRRSMDDSRAVVWKDGNVNSGVLLENSALLDVPPPSNLIGFQKIEIRYVDKSVITFLRLICHLFKTVDTTFTLPSHRKIDECPKFITFIWPLIARRLYRLDFITNRNFFLVRRLIAQTVLLESANLRVIHAAFVFPKTTADADDDMENGDGQALAKWLHTPRSDGRPKVLKCKDFSFEIEDKLEDLKMTFINAESPVSYIIYVRVFEPNDGIKPFECVNERTRERMTLEKTTGPEPVECGPEQYYDDWVLKRGPIWWGKSEWAESECQAKAWDLSEEMNVDLSEDMNLIYCDENVTFDKNITFG